MTALQSLAKADPYRNLGNALPAGWASLADCPDVQALGDWASTLAANLAQEGVLHTDWVVAVGEWCVLDAPLWTLLQAWHAGWQRLAQAPGAALVLQWPASADPIAALAVWQQTRRAQLPISGASLVCDTADVDWTRWTMFLDAVAADVQHWQVVAAAPTPLPDCLFAALQAGAKRLVVRDKLSADPRLLGYLRAYRLPVVVTAQAIAGLTALRDSGLLLCIAGDAEENRPLALTHALQQASSCFGWKLDDLRNATQRAIEAVWAPPAARHALARQAEAWRHRPPAQAAPSSDPFSL